MTEAKNDQQLKKRRRRWPFLVAAIPGLCIVAVGMLGQLRLVMLKHQLHASDRQVRLEALKGLANDGADKAADELREILAGEQDRQLVGWAGYAVLRSQKPEGIKLLRQRADETIDDAVQAKLIIHAARLARFGEKQSLLSWLEQGVQSDQPWRRVGSAVGLLMVGEPRGGKLLIEIGRDGPIGTRALAIKWLHRVAEPMSEAIGQPIKQWPQKDENPADWSQVESFWNTHADRKLLNDVLERLEERDPQWYELNRLLHAREKVARLFSKTL